MEREREKERERGDNRINGDCIERGHTLPFPASPLTSCGNIVEQRIPYMTQS